ncbi:MAG TPA: hypothetical protein VGH72_04865, partial [Pseudonocardia sp.]
MTEEVWSSRARNMARPGGTPGGRQPDNRTFGPGERSHPMCYTVKSIDDVRNLVLAVPRRWPGSDFPAVW